MRQLLPGVYRAIGEIALRLIGRPSSSRPLAAGTPRNLRPGSRGRRWKLALWLHWVHQQIVPGLTGHPGSSRPDSAGHLENVCPGSPGRRRNLAPWIYRGYQQIALGLTGRCREATTYTDNETAFTVISTACSRKMAYLKKHQAISIGFGHDWHNLPENLLVRIGIKEMLADLLTKPLDHEDHWRLVELIGMIFVIKSKLK